VSVEHKDKWLETYNSYRKEVWFIVRNKVLVIDTKTYQIWENYICPDFYPITTDELGWEIIRKSNKEFSISFNGLIVGKIGFEVPLFFAEKKVPLKETTEIACSLKLKT